MGKFIDITGKRFGRWTVLAMHPKRARDGRILWPCRCKCGTERFVLGYNLRTGGSTCCGCVRRKEHYKKRNQIIDLTRRRFGRWMVLALHLERDQYGHVLWSCRCDCGTERIVRGDTLRGGISTSCGCFLPEAAKKHRTTHGMFGTRVYKIWQGMLQRCTNPNNSGYANYGGRGITVCEEWLSFENFYADVGDPPPGLSLDRTNNNGNYEPTNWGWATPLMQTRNRRPRSKTKIKTLPVKPAGDDPVSNIPF